MSPIQLGEMTDRDILVQIATTLDGVTKTMETWAENGFPRCKMEHEKMEHLNGKCNKLLKAACGVAVLFVTDLVHRVVQ